MNDWKQGDEKPSKPGWYECQLGSFGELLMRYWDGEHWLITDGSRIPEHSTFGTYSSDRWREIA